MIIASMREHMNDPEIQWHGCGALHNLALNGELLFRFFFLFLFIKKNSFHT